MMEIPPLPPSGMPPAEKRKVYSARLRAKKQSSAEAAAASLYEKYLRLGFQCGCPVDQMRNFWNAQVFLQKKQLEFCALARQCDHDGGPKAILSGGGRGSSKSHAILAQVWCDDCQRMPELKFLLLRKVGQANKEQVSDFVTKLISHLPHKYK